MKSRMLAAVAMLGACAGCASAPPPSAGSVATPVATTGEARHLLRGSECLDPAMARSWIDLDHGAVLVDGGRHKYLIQVSGACSALGWSPLLVFRGDPVSGRVCGGLGDAILTRDYPCNIVDMQLLDTPQYKAMVKDYDARRHRKPVAAPRAR